MVINSNPNAFYISHYHRYYNYYFEQFKAPQLVNDLLDPNLNPTPFSEHQEVIVLNAHFKERLSDMQQYHLWTQELNDNFYIKKEFHLPNNKTENAILYIRKN
jgi:hypothetical protein